MKRGVMWLAVTVLFVLISAVLLYSNLTGNAISGGEHAVGPTLEQQACMRACASEGCSANDTACMMSHGDACMVQCNAQKPETTDETSCMEECVVKGCGEFDFECQGKNKAECETECGMIKEPEAKSEEEKCIRECVAKVDPELICSGGEGGEKGNEVCQKCADECVYLYAGPCLGDAELKQKQKDCETCEHCYGEPVLGDSGEGYQCTVDIKCSDASSEFGDEPGIGAGIVKAAGNVVNKVIGFFKGLFGGEKEQTEEEVSGPSAEENTEPQIPEQPSSNQTE